MRSSGGGLEKDGVGRISRGFDANTTPHVSPENRAR
jgi:hypothetical protein